MSIDGRKIAFHRWVLEQKLGRRLTSDEITHHIDEDPLNNDPDNLIPLTRAEHTRLHRLNYRGRHARPEERGRALELWRAGMTVAQVAAVTGRPHSTISYWTARDTRCRARRDDLHLSALCGRRDKRDGGKEVYVVSADGSGQRRLTRDARYPAAPAWSPDGRQIAFEGGPYALSGVYVVNADGSGQRRLARNGGTPAWSPDGRTIAFFSGGKIYLMNADGSEHRPLTKQSNRLTNGRTRSLAWSPDGRKLVFLGQSGCGDFCFHVIVMNADGSNVRDLTPHLGRGPGQGAADPAWSPDGRRIAFVRGFSSPDAILVVKSDGSGLRNLTPKPVGAYAAPAWSPDGRRIAFVGDRDGNSEVYVMNANGKGQRSLTRNPAFDADPAWSPDGGKIAFVSNRDGSYGVYVMNSDGSGQQRVAQHSP